MDMRYTVDDNQVVYEQLGSEVMVVNLDNGYYYVIEGTGADLWQWLVGGATAAEAAEGLARRYAGSREAIDKAVRDFVAELTAEALLKPMGEGAASGEAAAARTPAPEAGSTQAAFTLPAMFKYTDMAKLIQMDPIREFDETGWPKRRSAPPAGQP